MRTEDGSHILSDGNGDGSVGHVDQDRAGHIRLSGTFLARGSGAQRGDGHGRWTKGLKAGWQESLDTIILLWQRHPRFVQGVMAQFFYIGAQVGVCSFLIRYVQTAAPGVSEKEAAECLFYHLMLFLLGRIIGTAMMNRVKPASLLLGFAASCVTLSLICIYGEGQAAIAAVVLIGFFNSIMFPTIFSLAVRGLGSLVKLASSLLIMSAIGGALTPAAMGLLSDVCGIRVAFTLLTFSYSVVSFFAMRVRGGTGTVKS